MELGIFKFIDEVIDCLEKYNEELETSKDDIKLYFKDITSSYGDGYLNIVSRVKSSNSLKEKILRNNYYKKYSSPKELLCNLHDLIGIRIECKFINDEKKIFHLLKKEFNKINEDGLYYNPKNRNICLDLKELQPQIQKNGFQIYKIDGIFNKENETLMFELQIKSLVNVFWGEIEHKIIYKNYSYILTDNFLKEIMSSLKKNLTMIDNQLQLIYNQFNRPEDKDFEFRKAQVEAILAKGIYDIFALRMKNNIGFVVDFKKSCETIIKYIFKLSKDDNLEEYNALLINALTRLNELSHDKIDFSDEIIFEREVSLKDEFCNSIATTLKSIINYDFQWNLFFKILFHLEPKSNIDDFESFIIYLKESFYNDKELNILQNTFGQNEGKEIYQSLLLEISVAFKEIKCIEFIYENNIKEVRNCIKKFCLTIIDNMNSYEEWRKSKTIFLKLFRINLFLIFNEKFDKNIVNELIEEVKYCPVQIEVQQKLINHLDKLDLLCELKKNEIKKFFKVLS